MSVFNLGLGDVLWLHRVTLAIFDDRGFKPPRMPVSAKMIPLLGSSCRRLLRGKDGPFCQLIQLRGCQDLKINQHAGLRL